MRVVLWAFVCACTLWAVDTNSSIVLEQSAKTQVLLAENPWIQAWHRHEEEVSLKKELKRLRERMAEAKEREGLSANVLEMQREEVRITSRLAVMGGSGKGTSFDALLTPDAIPPRPEVSNPFALINAYSYERQLNRLQRTLEGRNTQLDLAIEAIAADKERFEKALKEPKTTRDSNQTALLWGGYTQAGMLLDALVEARDRLRVVAAAQTKAIQESRNLLETGIDEQVRKLLTLGIVVLSILLISGAIKLLLKRYVTDNELFYTISKVVNVINLTIFIFSIIFIYINDVSHFVTFLGFASAGLAIAMKDWFMSLLGWAVIMIGGTIRVGDRIKVIKEGDEVIGDVLDISPTRITLYEEITLLSYVKHKRAGRIIFVPNNYVFTNLILNYSHAGLKTIWDCIDITITFDSNHKKAAHLAAQIAKSYSKGYMEITRKQFVKLRDRYSLKNTHVEPRVYTLIEPYGVRISLWYLTGSFAVMSLKSSISSEIVDAFRAQEDIWIAYPTQQIHLGDAHSIEPPSLPSLFGTEERM